jgi:hypothetical protein
MGLNGAVVVIAKGCVVPGDGGGGLFYWDTSSTTGDDGGTIIVPTNPTGRWVRVYSGALDVRWFGAQGDGEDATAAIDNAIAVANAIAAHPGTPGATIYFPPGNYAVSAPLTPITSNGVHLQGGGAQATVIAFGTGPIHPSWACVTFRMPGNGLLDDASVRDMSFNASGDTGSPKVAIDAWVTSGLVIENVVVGQWSSGTTSNLPSIGIRTQGHERTIVRNVTIGADRPISIEKDPTAIQLSIDADHFHFQDLYLIPLRSGESCIVIAGQVYLSNFTMDGSNALVGGLHGIYFQDPSTNTEGGQCYSISISNVRREQTAATTAQAPGYVVYFSLVKRQMFNVCLRNVAADGNYLNPYVNGFYFRNVRSLTLENCIYPGSLLNGGTATALDMDGSHDGAGGAGGCWDVALLNTFFQSDTTISAPGMVRTVGFQRYTAAYAQFTWFDTTTDPNPTGISLGGTMGAGGAVSAYVNIVTGAAAPTATFPGDLPLGSLYLNQAGGVGHALWVKEAPGANGWNPK